ncbi:OmpA family protein [Chiayiivirga flava]|uniref:Outer membrane protein OmpA-like peptidoglycan-associated protein n=1 Tax=Chiayiivirga flava TaxID=659595 RepID=A0A7W8DAK5_9GAMM|nr:OmpA family protein [Chiayiivirga flava]MBB5209178.1 outer membrane protein OmpA-like peptidoglycan-associated protein [Chiayiivirga flava]
MNAVRTGLFLLALALAADAVAAPKVDPTVDRLRNELRALTSDPGLGDLAEAERIRAEQAIAALAAAGRREREALAYIAERRVDIARSAAEVQFQQRQLDQLEREKDRIVLQATQRDAELARLEAEKLRLQNLARQEETLRAQQNEASAIALSELSSAEAEQARRVAAAQQAEASLARQEADLAFAAAESLRLQLQSMTARSDARGQVMTLAGDAFASGQSSLRAEARSNLQRVVEFVNAYPGQPVLIEGHTDSQGSANLNQVLSQKRAEAVRDALIQDGVDGSRLSALGVGEDRPVADNASEDGRARNRRVEIVVQGAGAP